MDSIELGNLLPEIPNFEKAVRQGLILGWSWPYRNENFFFISSSAPSEKVVNLFGGTGIVHSFCHHHPDGEIG